MAVPTIGLVYDPKVASFLEELGLPSAGHVENFDAAHAVALTDALMTDYDETLNRLRERSEAMSAAAGENERLLLELLKKVKGVQ